MNRIHHIRRIRHFIGVLAGLVGVVLVLSATAPAALATLAPPDPAGPAVLPAPTHTVVVGGMPGWQITLIAVGAALLAATVAVLLDRARAARHATASAT
jgi:hypothetical protein